jgi:hypothetical protein
MPIDLDYDTPTRRAPWWRENLRNVIMAILLVALLAYLIACFVWGMEFGNDAQKIG